MSTRADERIENPLRYPTVSKELAKHLIHIYYLLPKRATFTVGVEMTKIAQEIYKYALLLKHYYNTDKDQAKKYCTHTLGLLNYLKSYEDFIKLFNKESKVKKEDWDKLNSLIEEDYALLSGVKKTLN